MANFKLVVSDPKSRKSFQKEVDQSASGLIGKKIGEIVKADNLGLKGYSLQVTGGSDKQGFPMRSDIDGIGRKKALLTSPPGFHAKIKGQRKRKSVRGNTISQDVVQINTKVVEYGSEKFEKFVVKKEAKKEEKPEKPKEEKKPEKTKEEFKKPEPKKEPKKEEATEKKDKPTASEPKKQEKPAEKPKEEKN